MQIVVARNLEVTHGIDDNVKMIKASRSSHYQEGKRTGNAEEIIDPRN